MFKFKNTPLEQVFVLSPFFWSWAIVFNVPNSKHVLSRLIAIICIYLIVAYKGELKESLKIKHKRIYVSILLLSFLYYVFLHVYNDGHFDFSRVLIACSLYFYLLPKKFFNIKVFEFLISSSSCISIIFGIYERFFLGIERIGMLVNSGPYAYVIGLLLICQVYLLVNNYSIRLKLGVGVSLSIGLVYLIILSETRAVWLGIGLLVFFITLPKLFVRKNNWKYFFLLGLFFLFQTLSLLDSVSNRIDYAIQDIKGVVNNGNYNSSSGARIDLWRNGINFSKESLIIGLHREKEDILIRESYIRGGIQSVAYYILTRTDRSSYHNVFIQSLVKGGIIALILMFIMILSPVYLSSLSTRNFTICISVYTIVCANFESQFTIYSSCAYFYILLMGFIIHIGHEQRE